MSMEIAKPTARISSGFRRIVAVFLAGEGLPFSQILAAERIERICGQHGCLFGRHGIFSTPVVLWAFLSQVLRDGKEAACQAAVASIAAARLERGADQGGVLHAARGLPPGPRRAVLPGDLAGELAAQGRAALRPRVKKARGGVSRPRRGSMDCGFGRPVWVPRFACHPSRSASACSSCSETPSGAAQRRM